ncbi:hypothetical protein Q2E61_00475 [Microbulbifer thermotolerans]|uniref:hypothetical protein n=1 Tax=Microbulbifer thermotolerans TaxID=252514 RepID=UPI00267415C5|nr:hypothetical protein [Microbulbifer thermotolerans]WKT60706.1 hypothetical protein Q2E61_00475 [Microbulbifer thermotolerans]
MKKLLILLFTIIPPLAWGCGGIGILNSAGFALKVGYDLKKLRTLDDGENLQLEMRRGHVLHIKSVHQNCMYEVSTSIEVQKLKNQQFIVKENGDTIEPKACQ